MSEKDLNKYKPWTKAETNFLRVNYGKMTAKEIGEKIGRPLQAIYGKVKAEKLRKAMPYMYAKKKVSVAPKIEKQEIISQKVIARNTKSSEISIGYSEVASTLALTLAVVSIALHFIH